MHGPTNVKFILKSCIKPSPPYYGVGLLFNKMSDKVTTQKQKAVSNRGPRLRIWTRV